MQISQHIISILTLITTVASSQKFNVYSDIFESPKFTVKYNHDHKITSDAARRLIETSKNSSYDLVKLSNQQFLCVIPEVITEDEDKNIERILGLEKLAQLSNFIDKKLNNITLFYISGYFTYAFTHNRKVEQFFGNPMQYLANNVTLVYNLGETKTKGVPHLKLKKDGELWSLARVIENGSVCDLTSKPRRTEVQYICNPANGLTALEKVYEQKTCDYVIQISIPELCEEDFFQIHEGEISCQEVIDDTETKIEDERPVWVHLSDFNLQRINQDLFIGKPANDRKKMSVLFDLCPKSSITEKLGNSFFKAIKTKLTSSSTQATYLMASQSFKYSSYVYDKFGNYLTTVVVEYESEDITSHIVIHEYKDMFDLEENFSDITSEEKEETAAFEVVRDTQEEVNHNKNIGKTMEKPSDGIGKQRIDYKLNDNELQDTKSLEDMDTDNNKLEEDIQQAEGEEEQKEFIIIAQLGVHDEL